MVGRLVEEQDVGTLDEEGGERDPPALSAGEWRDGRVESTDPGTVGPAEQTLEDVADARVSGPLVLGEVPQDDLVNRAGRVESVVLAEGADGEATDPRHASGVDGPRAREHAQQGRLAAAIAPDDADAVTTPQAEGDGVEHLGGAEGEGSTLDRDEVGHGRGCRFSRPGRE